MSNKVFPADFLWGVCTAAFQIEGAAAEDGRGPSIWDTFAATPGKIFDGSDATVACDHYHRYRDDVALMAQLGAQGYRFSISWPRVQPDGAGAWNDKGFDFYDRLLDELGRHGIQAFATLYHWDLPQALQDKGGWLNRDTCLRMADYGAEVARRFGDRLASVATHNEPWCTAELGHGTGVFAPGYACKAMAAQVAHHLLLSHGLSLQAMRAAGARMPLGIVLNTQPYYPATFSLADRERAALENDMFLGRYTEPLFNGRYPERLLRHLGDEAPRVQQGDFDIIRQPLDFLGINYYTRGWSSTATPPVPAPRAMGNTDMGWEIYPDGFTDQLMQLHREYRLPPLYITENGMACADRVSADGAVHDPRRIAYLSQHFDALHRAMQQGVDVRGYFVWSLLDNFEWNSGYRPRFGLVYTDYQSQRRIPKDSAWWYRDFIAAQGAKRKEIRA